MVFHYISQPLCEGPKLTLAKGQLRDVQCKLQNVFSVRQ